jgi:hypothetical protein
MKTLKGGITRYSYNKLNFFYKQYYKFMCFFNDRYCIPKTNANPYNANKGITQKKPNGPRIPKTNSNPYNANKGITQNTQNTQKKPTGPNYRIQPRTLKNVLFHGNNTHFNSLVERSYINNLGEVAKQNALISRRTMKR